MLAEQAHARLAAIVQDSEDAIFSETFEGVITSWNRGAEQLFGYSEAEAIGRKSADIITSERTAEERQAIGHVVGGERAEERAVETILACKDGKFVHVLQTISPVNDERGKQIGVSIIARNVTERKNLEREVLESTSREQQRIGRELHDSLGQELTGLSYLAKSLAQKLAAAGSPQTETAQLIAVGDPKGTPRSPKRSPGIGSRRSRRFRFYSRTRKTRRSDDGPLWHRLSDRVYRPAPGRRQCPGHPSLPDRAGGD